MPVSVAFENLEDGMTIDEVMEQFPVPRDQIQAVLEFAARSLDTFVPADCGPGKGRRRRSRHGRLTSVPPSSSMPPTSPVTYFRPRRSGPESVIEDFVAAQLPALFKGRRQFSWTAGSIPLGAGIPDLVIVAYKPLALALADADLSDTQILGYLRAVRSARLGTIAERLRVPNRSMGRRLHRLVEARALRVTADETFALTMVCRNLLPDIITIEVKVGNWQRAADQARRNRIFSHRSFVALPLEVAERVHNQPTFTRHGLGVLGVSPAGGVEVTREARRTRPVVWAYYYQLAALIARSTVSSKHAV